MPDLVDDPAFPDRVSLGGGPLIPCRVTEFSVTNAPVATEGPRDSDGTKLLDQTRQYGIRYPLPPGPEQRARDPLTEALRAKLGSMWVGYEGFDSCAGCEFDCNCQTCPTSVLALIAALNVGHGPSIRAIAKELGIEVPA